MNQQRFIDSPALPPDWRTRTQLHGEIDGKCKHCGLKAEQHLSGNYWCPPRTPGDKP